MQVGLADEEVVVAWKTVWVGMVADLSLNLITLGRMSKMKKMMIMGNRMKTFVYNIYRCRSGGRRHQSFEDI